LNAGGAVGWIRGRFHCVGETALSYSFVLCFFLLGGGGSSRDFEAYRRCGDGAAAPCCRASRMVYRS
jgi:hypothetical protein